MVAVTVVQVVVVVVVLALDTGNARSRAGRSAVGRLDPMDAKAQLALGHQGDALAFPLAGVAHRVAARRMYPPMHLAR